MLREKNDLFWVDAVRAICLICVYYAHSEHYLGLDSSFVSRFFSPFYVNAFFAVSGYLFYRSLFAADDIRIFVRKKLGGLFFRLFLPLLFFSSVIFLPKSLFHGTGLSAESYLFSVIGGCASWFVSAMICIQLCVLLSTVCFKKNLHLHLVVSIGLFAGACLLKKYFPGPFPFYWKSGMAAVLLFVLGGYYRKFEILFERTAVQYSTVQYSTVQYSLLIVYLLCIFLRVPSLWVVMGLHFNVIGFLIMSFSTVLLFQFCKQTPENAFFRFTGRNSIVCYFVSGVFPAFAATFWKRYIPWKDAWTTPVVTAVSFLAATLFTWLVLLYIPFLLDIRKLRFHVKS